MVKIKGPLGSAEASGAFGGTAVFSSWKGRSYARTKTIPTNPKTGAQVSVRAMMTFLAQVWTTMSDANKATWQALAESVGIPPYNAFISTNLERWGQFRAPGRTSPIGSTGTLSNGVLFTATGHAGYVDLFIMQTILRDGWGVILFRNQVIPLLPTREDAIHVFHTPTSSTFHYDDQGLDPGVYQYKLLTFTTDGKKSVSLVTKTATVT